MSKSYYLYVSSKNRNLNETINNFTINLKIPISCAKNEYMNISVVNFSMLNTDYNLRNIYFKVDSVRLSDNQEITYTYNIPDGNYSYQSLMDYLNTILNGKINISYVKERNSYKFRNIDNSNYDFYIIPFNANKILGLNDELNLIDGDYHEGGYINLVNYSHIIIKSNYLDFEDNTQDNLNNKEIGASSILFMIDKQDILPFQLISYRNYDGGNNYNYNINNKQISNIDFQLYNELGEKLTNVSDYFLVLKINIINRPENNNSSSILEDIKFILMSMMFGNKNKNLLL
jgi:hypothetical protein